MGKKIYKSTIKEIVLKHFNEFELEYYKNMEDSRKVGYSAYIRRNETFRVAPSQWEKRIIDSQGYMSFAQIARILGMNEFLVKDIYDRAMKKLRKNEKLKNLL